MSGNITPDLIINENIGHYTKCFKVLEGKFVCQIGECTCKFTDKSAGARHLKSKHPEIVVAINRLKGNQSAHDNSIEIRMKINPTTIWNAILQMIIFGALPFATVHSAGFRNLIKPFITGFNQVGIDFTVNIPKLKTNIEEKAKKIKQRITDEAKGKVVCLQLDIASRFNRSILGVNVSYLHNGKLCVRTIGMHTLKVSQTAKNLFDIVSLMLGEFGIRLQQIIAVTTDNGKNLLKLNKLIHRELIYQGDDVISDDGSDYEYDDEYDDDDTNHPTSNGDTNDPEIFDDPDIFDDEYFRTLLSKLRDHFVVDLFTGISCAAHGLHLIVTAAIKECSVITKVIDKCRDLTKKLRTPKLRAELKMHDKKMGLLDVKTRWSSLYHMVS